MVTRDSVEYAPQWMRPYCATGEKLVGFGGRVASDAEPRRPLSFRNRERTRSSDNAAIPITTTFASRVRDLNRRGLPLEAIALRLRASEDDVRWAHQILNLLPVGEIEPVTMPTPAEREAMLERLPKKMQDRIRHRGS